MKRKEGFAFRKESNLNRTRIGEVTYLKKSRNLSRQWGTPYFELKHIIEDRIMKELFLSLIEQILSSQERIIVLTKLGFPTGESEYDGRFHHLSHITYEKMASILNEIEDNRFSDWIPLTGEQVRAKYNYAIHKIYTYLEGTDLFELYG